MSEIERSKLDISGFPELMLQDEIIMQDIIDKIKRIYKLYGFLPMETRLVEPLSVLLEKGIEGYAFILHGSLTPKKIIETWNAAIKEDHPILLIATGGFLSFPRTDIETIVVERESSKTLTI